MYLLSYKSLNNPEVVNQLIAKIPNLIYYHDCKDTVGYCNTGQGVYYSGSVTATTNSNIQCLYLTGQTCFRSVITDNFEEISQEKSISIWINGASSTKDHDWEYTAVALGEYESIVNNMRYVQWLFTDRAGHSMTANSGYFDNDNNVMRASCAATFEFDKWAHYVYVIEKDKQKIYYNGKLVGEALLTNYGALKSSQISFGNVFKNSNDRQLNGYYAGIRVYNRALTSRECYILSREFKTEIKITD